MIKGERYYINGPLQVEVQVLVQHEVKFTVPYSYIMSYDFVI